MESSAVAQTYAVALAAQGRVLEAARVITKQGMSLLSCRCGQGWSVLAMLLVFARCMFAVIVVPGWRVSASGVMRTRRVARIVLVLADTTLDLCLIEVTAMTPCGCDGVLLFLPWRGEFRGAFEEDATK
eukprot:2875771-Rhodomonas_salina.1